jgi:hypothetical protein
VNEWSRGPSHHPTPVLKLAIVADTASTTQPPASAAGGVSQRSSFNLRENIVAQATAIITLTTALIVGGGALCLIFRLVYLRVAFSSVLGQLPESLYLWSGLLEVSIPAILLAIGLVYLEGEDRFQKTWKRVVLVVVAVAVFAGVGALLHFVSTPNTRTNLSGGPWPLWVETLVIAAIGSMAMFVMTTKKARRKNLLVRSFLGTILFTFVVASIAASTLLPDVRVCGPSFRTEDGYHELAGNLIGVSGDYAYVAQWPYRDGRIGTGFVTVVPLSTQSLLAIGTKPNCGDVQRPS